MLKEQKKLRIRLANKGERLRKLEEENQDLMLSNLRNSEKYRIEKMHAYDLQKKNYLITFYSKIIVFSLIASLVFNLYFILK